MLGEALHGSLVWCATLSKTTCAQGNVASWKKKEGEEFAAGDVLAEIETDKVCPCAIFQTSSAVE